MSNSKSRSVSSFSSSNSSTGESIPAGKNVNVNGFVILNKICASGWSIVKNSRKIVLPATLGAIGGGCIGYFVRDKTMMNAKIGMIQAVIQHLLHRYPFTWYYQLIDSATLDPNEKEKDGEYDASKGLEPSASAFLYFCGGVLNIALPLIILTKYHQSIYPWWNKCFQFWIPPFLKNHLLFEEGMKYSPNLGICVNVVPFVSQFFV